MKYKVYVNENGRNEVNFDCLINNWMPCEVKVTDVDPIDKEFYVEFDSLETITDMICNIGCSLEFNVICDEPVIFMHMD